MAEGIFRRLLRRAMRTLLAALIVPILVLVGVVQYLLYSAHWVDHSDRVIAEANHVEKLLMTMQSGYRGFRLNRDNSLLATYTDARDELPAHLQALARLVEDNPAQSATAMELGVLERKWVERVERSLATLAAGKTLESLPPGVQPAREIIQSAVQSAHTFIEEEEHLRAARSHTLDLVVTTLMVLFAVAALIGVPILILWLRRLLRAVSSLYLKNVASANLRAAELRVTLHSIGDAVIATDSEGRVDFVNPVAETLLGWSNAEARGRELTEVFPIFNEETGAVTANPVARVVRENIVLGLANHTMLRARNGREYPIEDSAAPIRDESGRVRGVILVFHDVSEKRVTEKLLQESKRRLQFLDELGEATRPLSDPARIMGVTTELLGRQLQASRCAYAEVARDQDHFSIIHDYVDGCASISGDYRLAQFGQAIAAQLRAGQVLQLQDIDAETGMEEGKAAFAALQIKAIICHPLLKEGALRAMMAIHQARPRSWTRAEESLIAEVTERSWATIERARAEVALRAARDQAESNARAMTDSARRFQLLSEVVALQVWTADVNGALDYANNECAAYFGADVQTAIMGNAWTQFVHPDDLPMAAKAWQASLTSGDRYEVEFRLRGKAAGFRWFLVRAQALRDPAGVIVKWFGTNTDIDDLKSAQDGAERASRAKDEFLAALSHELRTPLTPVLMAASALRDDMRLPPEVRDQLGMMERNISLEARLIDDLLDLTAISRGKLQLRSQICDAHSLIGQAIEIVREEARAKEVLIQRSFSARHSGIRADPARFQQVIWNLLRNAVKFTPPGGYILIQTGDEISGAGENWLRVEVTDSGIGIDPKLLEQIFHPFDQGELMGDHRFGGVGLGLAIARAVVDLHGGKIKAFSDGLNQGAKFVILFPDAGEPPKGTKENSAQAESDEDGSGNRISPLRLLLVEDHANTLQILLRLLELDGHQVVTAGTVFQALAAASLGKFDLVISDLGLPDGTGSELMEKLRELYGLRGIALSGYGMEEDMLRSQEAGFVAHLVKPVHFSDLRRTLKRAISDLKPQ